MLRDATFKEILKFLDACDQHGKGIPTVITHVSLEELGAGQETPTISSEARKLKSMFLKLRDW
jgi:tetratricopeptide repeat protein 30